MQVNLPDAIGLSEYAVAMVRAVEDPSDENIAVFQKLVQILARENQTPLLREVCLTISELMYQPSWKRLLQEIDRLGRYPRLRPVEEVEISMEGAK